MPYNLQKIQVLLVEDNEPMMQLIKAVLQSFGIGSIITALNGEEAFKYFCRYNPDIVITDWMMSPVDGLELSHLIRTHEHSPNKFVPIILMTGFSEEKRVINARDEGITEFLVKPFNTRDLYRRLHKIIESPRQFVKTTQYFGPDRRRKNRDSYDGKKRRMTDVDDKSKSDSANKDSIEIDFK